MAEKKIKAVLEIGGAISGTLNRTFAIATGNTKKLSGELKDLNARAKTLRADLKSGIGGKEASAELAGLESRIRSLKGSIGSLNTIKGLGIGEKIGRVGSTVARGFAMEAAGAVVLGAAVYKLAKSFGEYADNAAEAAGALSMDTNALISYKLAADDVGTGSENLSKSIAKMQKTLEDARGSKGSKVFQLLKLDVNKLSRQKPEQQIEAIAEAFSNYNGKISKTAIAMAIFGKSGAAMVNFLSLGKEGLKKYAEMAKKLGVTLTEEDQKIGDAFGTSSALLGTAFQGIQMTIGRELLPVLTQLQDKLTYYIKDIMPKIQEQAHRFGSWLIGNAPRIGDEIFRIANSLFDFGNSVIKFLEPVGGMKAVLGAFLVLPFVPAIAAIGSLGAALFAAIPAVVGMSVALIANPIGLIIAGIGLAAVGAAALIWANWDKVKGSFEGLGKSIQDFYAANKPTIDEIGALISRVFMGTIAVASRVVVTQLNLVIGAFKTVLDWGTRSANGIGNAWSAIKAIGGGAKHVLRSGPGAMVPIDPGGATSLGNPFIDGMRAAGGPVSAGKRYLVGERGPEIFSPRTSGQIIPNGGAADNRTYNNYITINATPGMNERSLADLVLARLDGRQAALASGALYD